MISKSEVQPFLGRYQDEENHEPKSQYKLWERLGTTSTLTKPLAGFVLLVIYTLLVTCATNIVVNRPGVHINNGKSTRSIHLVVA
jgi:hypothetical protein